MIGTPGTPAHVLALVRAYTAYEQTVRNLTPGLDADHSSAVAKCLADLDANLVKGDPEEVKAAIEKLRADDPLLFEPAPLGQHLLRLAMALNPRQDRACIAAAIDRMQRDTARRLGYEIKKKLAAADTPLPAPSPDDTNIATEPPGHAPMTPHKRFRGDQRVGNGHIGGLAPVSTDDPAPAVDADDRDALRPVGMRLQPMIRRK